MWPQVALRVTMAQPFCWHLPSDTELSNPGAPILGLPGSLASEAPTAVGPCVRIIRKSCPVPHLCFEAMKETDEVAMKPEPDSLLLGSCSSRRKPKAGLHLTRTRPKRASFSHVSRHDS